MTMSTFESSTEDLVQDTTTSPPRPDATTHAKTHARTGDAATGASEAVVTTPEPTAPASGSPVDDSPVDIDPANQAANDDADRAGEAEAEAEYDRIIHVPPTSLKIGPNIREDNAEPTRDEVKDYEKYGVEDAIKAYRDAEGALVVVKGQRRVLTAVKAKLASVPVWVQPAPSEDEKAATIDRIANQYRWTRHRKGLTRRDTFRAIEQLKLFGLSVIAITKRLSVPRREVADSLKVGTSELAAAAADKYDLTLDQAAEIAECEQLGDLDAAKDLITTAAEGPHNFKTLAQRLRNDRMKAEKLAKSIAACTDQLTADGVTILDESIADSDWTGQARSLDRLRPSPGHEPGTTLTPEDHATCPGHSAWILHDWDDDGHTSAIPGYACADFRAHGHALLDVRAGSVDYNSRSVTDTSDDITSHGVTGEDATGDGMNGVSALSVSGATISENIDPDAEAAAAYAAHVAAESQRRKAEIESTWEENNTEDAKAARTVRQEWLSAFARRKSIPKGARTWLALRTLSGAYALNEAMDSGHPLAHRLLGLPEPELAGNDWTAENAYERSELVERIETASDTKAAVYELYLFLCAYEQAFRTDSWRTPTETDQLYIRMLIDLGYEAPDIDRKVLDPDNLEDIIAAELGTEPTETDDTDSADDADSAGGDVRAETGAEPHGTESDQPIDLTGDGDLPHELATAAGQTPDDDTVDPGAVSSDQDGQRSEVDLAA